MLVIDAGTTVIFTSKRRVPYFITTSKKFGFQPKYYQDVVSYCSKFTPADAVDRVSLLWNIRSFCMIGISLCHLVCVCLLATIL